MVIDIQQKGVEYRVHSVLDHFGREQIEEVVCQNQEKKSADISPLTQNPTKTAKEAGKGRATLWGQSPTQVHSRTLTCCDTPTIKN